jgi:hypothetical protein
MRWIATVLLGLLCGCSGLAGVGPDVDFQIVVAAVQSCEAPPVSISSPTTAMEVGFAKIKAACEVFFVDATRAQQDALAASRGLDAGLIGATAIINATNSATAAAKAITITAAGIVLSKELINQYVNIYAFNTYLYKVRALVKASMADYITTARAHPPANYCIAYTYVADLASLCSLAAMKANLDQQVALPSVISADPGGGGGRALSTVRTAPRSNVGGRPTTNYTVRPAF